MLGGKGDTKEPENQEGIFLDIEFNTTGPGVRWKDPEHTLRVGSSCHWTGLKTRVERGKGRGGPHGQKQSEME